MCEQLEDSNNVKDEISSLPSSPHKWTFLLHKFLSLQYCKACHVFQSLFNCLLLCCSSIWQRLEDLDSLSLIQMLFDSFFSLDSRIHSFAFYIDGITYIRTLTTKICTIS